MLRFMWLAAVIAEHPGHKVEGRTRLQKTIKLLQRVGLPANYEYMIHFYGPYSEGLQSDVELLENFKMIQETSISNGANTKFVISADTLVFELEPSLQGEIEKFKKYINILSEEKDTTVLELAATYDSFREISKNGDEALKRLRLKKPEKCTPEMEKKAFFLLENLGIKYQ